MRGIGPAGARPSATWASSITIISGSSALFGEDVGDGHEAGEAVRIEIRSAGVLGQQRHGVRPSGSADTSGHGHSGGAPPSDQQRPQPTAQPRLRRPARRPSAERRLADAASPRTTKQPRRGEPPRRRSYHAISWSTPHEMAVTANGPSSDDLLSYVIDPVVVRAIRSCWWTPRQHGGRQHAHGRPEGRRPSRRPARSTTTHGGGGHRGER